jgi:hypothetical protein
MWIHTGQALKVYYDNELPVVSLGDAVNMAIDEDHSGSMRVARAGYSFAICQFATSLRAS